jgi:ketosteroid isomerase-like protein
LHARHAPWPSRWCSRHCRGINCSPDEEIGMSSRSKADIIRGVFAAYLSNDRKAVEGALADDFRFTSPYDDHIDKATYFERCWRNSDWIARHDIERICVEGEEAFLTYLCVAKSGKTFRNTEFFAFAGDRIKCIDVYFGATYQNGAFVRQTET